MTKNPEGNPEATETRSRLAEIERFYDRHSDLAASAAGQDALWLLRLVRELQAELARLKHSADSTHKAASDNYARASAAESREKELRVAAEEVWNSIPATYDQEDSNIERHAKALNALRAALAQPREEE